MNGLASRWMRLNTLALLVGYALYTPIGHGITGGHARELTPAQVLMHTVALSLVAWLVGLAQTRALAGLVEIGLGRRIGATIAFVIAFWVGYYQPWIDGPDTDILLGYLVLGAGFWIGLVPPRGRWFAYTVAILAFPIGSIVGTICLILVVVALGIEPSGQMTAVEHSIFWLTVGGVTGLVGGFAAGKALERLLR